MANEAAVPIQLKFTTGRVIRRSREVTARAFQEVSREMNRKLRKAISRPGPPRSRQGHYPKKDSGDLYRNTSVTAKGRTININTLLYGVYLDAGFNHHWSGKFVHRPWIQKVIFDKRRTWERKFNTAMRKYSAKMK